jgi:hypothetical protein
MHFVSITTLSSDVPILAEISQLQYIRTIKINVKKKYDLIHTDLFSTKNLLVTEEVVLLRKHLIDYICISSKALIILSSLRFTSKQHQLQVTKSIGRL